MGAYDIQPRVLSEMNLRAFLSHNRSLGYEQVVDWLIEKGVHNQTMDAAAFAIAEDKGVFTRALGPLHTGTDGAYNTVFGAIAHIQLPMGANGFQLMSMRMMTSGGFRAQKELSSTAFPGRAETAEISGPVMGKYDKVETPPVILDHFIATGHLYESMENKDDLLATANVIENERQTFMRLLNQNFLADVNSPAGQPEAFDMKSIHALTESYAHINASTSVVANTADFYNIDRDAGPSWADSYVNYNTVATDTPRELSRRYLDDALVGVGKRRLPFASPYGGGGIILTGHDTSALIDQLYESVGRLMPSMTAGVGINGVNTAPGQEVGIRANAYKGQPIFLDDCVPSPNSGTADVLGLDTSVTSIGITQGIQMFGQSDPLVTRYHADAYLFRMFGNTLVTMPSSNYKVTDIV